MTFAPLAEAADILMGQSPPGSTYNTEGKGLPFFQGKADFGDLYPTVRVYCTEPKRVAEFNDILISVRAPVGPTNLAPFKSAIGRGLAAIRSQSGTDVKYLLYFLRAYESKLAQIGKGSTFEAIGRDDLESIRVPLPPLPEQRRIAALLDRADRLRHTRRYAAQLSDSFLQAVFVRMFGDPVRNPMGWDEGTLEDLGYLGRGISKNRPRNAPELYGGTYPFIQTGDIANSGGYIRNYRQTYSELGLKQSKMWQKGTLCITIAANIAKTGILMFDSCFPDSVVGFVSNEKTNTEFIQLWFSFLQKRLEELAPESAQKNIDLEILRDLAVIVPPFALQQEFARIVQQFERLRAQQREADRQAEHLFQTLLHRAFSGEA